MDSVLSLPEKSKIKISIAIPSSILENCQDLRSKTEKIGTIARSCAIFKVEEIIIYPHFFKNKDSIKNSNLNFLKLLFNYIECPPYFRKRLYPISNSLKFSGLLPPLKISHHLLKNEISNNESGELREGVVINSNDKYSTIDLGFKDLFQINIPNLKHNQRITVFLKKRKSQTILTKVNRENINYYWGYRVYIKKIDTILKNYRTDIVILTSKYGFSINDYYVKLIEKLKKNSKILIMFGSPFEGLQKIFQKLKINIENEDFFYLNMVPGQGSHTITTEEAIFCTLSIFNFLNHF